MSNRIRIEVYKRIVLAKLLHRDAEAACTSRNDEMDFAKGILLLHDAAEAALGAVADHLHARLTGKDYLLDYYKLIEDADPQHKPVPYKSQMVNLNTLRISIKHQGILPDAKSNAHVPTTVQALIHDVCQTYLGIDFSSVSLKSLIRNKTVRNYIDQAEKAIEEGKIRGALISLAYAMYHICEGSTIPWPFTYKEEKKQYEFTEPYELRYKVELIQHGVDPYLYYRFKNLTPSIAREKDTGKLVYWWDKHYGHAKNWTIPNARFCLNLCIDTALKFQREEDEGYTLIPYFQAFEDIIEPAHDEATIWNYSSKFHEDPSEPKRQILVLKKGQSIIGWAMDSQNNRDEWFIVSRDIQSKSKDKRYGGYGYVSKSEVKVTTRERQVPKKSKKSEVKQQEKVEGT